MPNAIIITEQVFASGDTNCSTPLSIGAVEYPFPYSLNYSSECTLNGPVGKCVLERGYYIYRNCTQFSPSTDKLMALAQSYYSIDDSFVYSERFTDSNCSLKKTPEAFMADQRDCVGNFGVVTYGNVSHIGSTSNVSIEACPGPTPVGYDLSFDKCVQLPLNVYVRYQWIKGSARSHFQPSTIPISPEASISVIGYSEQFQNADCSDLTMVGGLAFSPSTHNCSSFGLLESCATTQDLNFINHCLYSDTRPETLHSIAASLFPLGRPFVFSQNFEGPECKAWVQPNFFGYPIGCDGNSGVHGIFVISKSEISTGVFSEPGCEGNFTGFVATLGVCGRSRFGDQFSSIYTVLNGSNPNLAGAISNKLSVGHSMDPCWPLFVALYTILILFWK